MTETPDQNPQPTNAETAETLPETVDAGPETVDAPVAADAGPETVGAAAAQPVRARGRTALALTAFLLPIVLAVVAVIALAGVGDDDGGSSTPAVPTGQVYSYLIPPGTAFKMQNNQYVADIMPELVPIRVGDTIEVVNEDTATHTFGPITVRAGETVQMPFLNPGYYFGLCSAGTHDTLTIQVT